MAEIKFLCKTGATIRFKRVRDEKTKKMTEVADGFTATFFPVDKDGNQVEKLNPISVKVDSADQFKAGVVYDTIPSL